MGDYHILTQDHEDRTLPEGEGLLADAENVNKNLQSKVDSDFTPEFNNSRVIYWLHRLFGISSQGSFIKRSGIYAVYALSGLVTGSMSTVGSFCTYVFNGPPNMCANGNN